jgi:hypothetical protein
MPKPETATGAELDKYHLWHRSGDSVDYVSSCSSPSMCLLRISAANQDHLPLPASRQTTTPSLRNPISTCRTTVGDGFDDIRSASSACPATKYPSQLVVTLEADETPLLCCPRTVTILIDPTARTTTTTIDPTILVIFALVFINGCRRSFR